MNIPRRPPGRVTSFEVTVELPSGPVTIIVDAPDPVTAAARAAIHAPAFSGPDLRALVIRNVVPRRAA